MADFHAEREALKIEHAGDPAQLDAQLIDLEQASFSAAECRRIHALDAIAERG